MLRDASGEETHMQESQLDYLIRDQDGDTPRTLDLLQAWGPPLRPPLRARAARLLIRLANWLYTPPAPAGSPCFLTCSPHRRSQPGAAQGSLSG
jgi:hypothetical protein